MAEHLATIFGTEKDKVNCPFYFKIGACRHGERCSRVHNKPQFSETILFPNLYQDPRRDDTKQQSFTDQDAREHFEDFYEDVGVELAKYGDLTNLYVCDNICEHLGGNVYATFADEEASGKAMDAMSGRFYNKRPVRAEYSPVTDFREARCRQYELGECGRGGYCNFMHLKHVSAWLRHVVFGRKGHANRDQEGDNREQSSPRQDEERLDDSVHRNPGEGEGDDEKEQKADRFDSNEADDMSASERKKPRIDDGDQPTLDS